MSVFVRKSPTVLVRPLELSSMNTSIKLSSSDKGVNKMPVIAFLMFEHPIHEVANTIKRALSHALVHYYSIAGRIVAGASDDEVHIECNGEGVPFVSASANCALKDVKLLDQSRATRTLLDDLALCPDTGFGPTDPLFLMQVTEFSCSGFVIGVTWNHAIADGVGMAQFLQAIGELACGLSAPSIVPVRWDASLLSSLPSRVILQQPGMSQEPFNDIAYLEITVPSRIINRIKSEFSNRFPGEPSTSKFDVVSAVLWQSRTRAIMCNPEIPALFSYVANVRKHLGTEQGYYGNCMTRQQVVATSGSVANGDILDLIRMIKHSKEKIADQIKDNDGSSPQQAAGQQMQQLVQLRYNMLMVSSWANLGFEEADFGSGSPARVTPYGKFKPLFPICVVCLPWKGKDGVNVFAGIVKEEHVDAFLGELARFA